MMQNVRMIVASFLTEYLNIDWVEGEKWFHWTLVDADVAINAMMWQNAGRSGIDQWNFVMSPENGSQDPTGAYVKRWVPELAGLPSKYIHKPWTAPDAVLSKAGVELGVSYPHRMVTDLGGARAATAERVVEMRRANLHLNDAQGYDLVDIPGQFIEGYLGSGERTK